MFAHHLSFPKSLRSIGIFSAILLLGVPTCLCFADGPTATAEEEIQAPPPVENYLDVQGLGTTPEAPTDARTQYQTLRTESEYPRIEARGELRTRLEWTQNAMDLGSSAQPMSLRFDNPLFPFVGDQYVYQEFLPPDSNHYSYVATHDNYIALFERFLGSVDLKFNRDITGIVTMKVLNNNFGGLKYTRDMSLEWLQKQSMETYLDEVYLKITDCFVDGLTLRTGRQFLDFDFGFLFNGFTKEQSFDLGQAVYTANPWQFSFFYMMPSVDKRHSMYTLTTTPDTHGGYVRYKAETWRYSFAYAGTNEQHHYEAPISFFNQLLWDPVSAVETETSVVYQLGKIENVSDQHQSALGLNLIGKYKSNLPLLPQFRLEFLLGQGGKDNAKKDFVSLANDTEYGHIVQAFLTNLVMIHPSVSLQITRNSSLIFDHYYFTQYRSRIAGVSDPRLDNGGITIPTNGQNKDIGNEFDITHEWAILDNLKSQMYIAWFFPGHAFGYSDAAAGQSFPNSQWNTIPFEYRWQILFNF